MWWSRDRVYVVDVNPRITTSLVGIAACMNEEIAALLVEASHGNAPKEVHSPGRCGLTRTGRSHRHDRIDVGGANLKVVDENGVHIHYCPLWTGAPITGSAAAVREWQDGDRSGRDERRACRLFRKQAAGNRIHCQCGPGGFPAARFYGTDAQFHDGPVPALAAANWLASADFLREKYPDAVLLDIGSTTADIIPLSRFPALLAFLISHGFRKDTSCTRHAAGHRWQPSFRP